MLLYLCSHFQKYNRPRQITTTLSFIIRSQEYPHRENSFVSCFLPLVNPGLIRTWSWCQDAAISKLFHPLQSILTDVTA